MSTTLREMVVDAAREKGRAAARRREDAKKGLDKLRSYEERDAFLKAFCEEILKMEEKKNG